MTLAQTLRQIGPADQDAYAAAQAHWYALAKPLDGLGLLEKAVCHLAAACGNPQVRLDRRFLAIFCADNGVVAEGVTQTDSSVTAVVTENFCNGLSSVCHMARLCNCQVLPVDVGMLSELQHPAIRTCKTARGTNNIAQGPAMSRAQAIAAIEVGIEIASEQKEAGCDILAGGEMGIGNTTSSSAVAAVLLGVDAACVTGRGAGLSSAGLQRKIAVVEQAIALNQPDAADPVDVLAKVGGFDIAAMCGLYLGAAAYRLPVVLDGMISGVAALCASRLAPDCSGYMLASHISAEPAARMVLDALQLTPLICADMHLGEGSGAIALLPLLDLALAVYYGCPTFDATDIETYLPQE